MASPQLRRRLWIVSVALVAGALAIGAIAVRRSPAPGAPAPRFALLDHDGVPFGRERLEGRWSLIFFGYAHCPDVCPLALQLAHRARQQLLQSSGAEPPPLIFVSLDPEQDTPAALKDYVQRFDASFLGVTGPSAEVARLEDWLASAHRVGAERIDHGAYLYVIDPQARAAGRIEGVGEPSALAERIRAAISAERG
jgi:protein SCO1